MQFEAKAGDCPRSGYPKNFLAYRVTGAVTRVAIDAVYADGRTRRAHEVTRPSAVATLASPGVSDPGISAGQVAYVLEATGEDRKTATRRIPFRTPAPLGFELAGPVREVVDSQSGATVRNHYEVDVQVENPEPIQRISMQARRADQSPVHVATARLAGRRLVSQNVVWTDDEAGRTSVASFLVRVYTRDACGESHVDRTARLAR